MKVAIIGGGFMGLSLAQKLASPEHQIKVFEREEQLGGLATYHDYGSFTWDRFYHVILPGDKYLLNVLKAVGLEDEMVWEKTYTGVYVDEQFYSVSNNKEFLLFPPLNLIQKARLAFTILYASRIKNWQRMEKMTVEEWLIKLGGRKTYEKFWKPLLLAKLGDSYSRVSAVFIWTYIKRLFEARGDSSQKQEKMGYVKGGYKTVFDAMERYLNSHHGEVHKGTSIQKIEGLPSGGIELSYNGQKEYFDKVIFTGPVNVLEKLSSPDLVEVSKNGQAVEYLGVVCMILLTKKPITEFYVLNIADKRIPFTGVIGMSTLVDPSETGGYYMTYLPKYIISTDPLLQKSDEELTKMFLDGVKIMYPDLQEEDIVETHLNRAFKVQPVQVLNFSQIIPQTRTKHEDFFVLNTSQFVNDTLNNNSVARHVDRFIETYKNQIFESKTQKAATVAG